MLSMPEAAHRREAYTHASSDQHLLNRCDYIWVVIADANARGVEARRRFRSFWRQSGRFDGRIRPRRRVRHRTGRFRRVVIAAFRARPGPAARGDRSWAKPRTFFRLLPARGVGYVRTLKSGNCGGKVFIELAPQKFAVSGWCRPPCGSICLGGGAIPGIIPGRIVQMIVQSDVPSMILHRARVAVPAPVVAPAAAQGAAAAGR